MKSSLTTNDGIILKILVSKFNSRWVYFLGMTDVSFFSSDCGKTVTAFEHHITMTNFELSANSQFILGQSLILCEEENCPHYYNLHLSEDHG